MTRKVSFALFALLACIAPLPGQDATAFRAGLDAVSAAMGEARWADAAAALARVLAEQGGTDHARYARREIEMLDQRCRFHLGYEPPAPATLITGRIVKYKPERGLIELRYDKDSLDDFSFPIREQREQEEARRNRPLPDNLTKEQREIYEKLRKIQESLKNRPRFRERREPDPMLHPAVFRNYTLRIKGVDYRASRLMLCLSEDGYFEIDLGEPPSRRKRGGSYYPTRVTRVRGTEREELDVEHWGADKRVEPKRRRRGEPEPDRYAHVKFPMHYDGGFDVEVRVYPTNIRCKVNGKLVAKIRKKSEEAGKIALDFPSFETIEIEGTVDPSWLQGRVDEARRAAFDEFVATYDPKQTLPAWLLAEAPAGEAKVAELPSVEQVRRLLREQKLDEVGRLLDAAKAAGPLAGGLLQAERILEKMRHGPNWTRIHRVATEHYDIASDIGEEVCADAGVVLEAGYAYYGEQLGRPPADGRRFPVFVFSSRAGFDEYCEDIELQVPLHTSGLYIPALGQLLIWNLPDRSEMFRTIRHEGFHQYFDAVVPTETPVWLNEGLAEYYEAARGDLTRPSPGRIQPRHLRALEQFRSSRTKVRRLVTMTPRWFYRKAHVHYAQSWALVHYLRNTTPGNKQLLESLLAGLFAGRPGREVLAELIDEDGLNRLDGKLDAYVDSLIARQR